jgi:hypothetical protein
MGDRLLGRRFRTYLKSNRVKTAGNTPVDSRTIFFRQLYGHRKRDWMVYVNM